MSRGADFVSVEDDVLSNSAKITGGSSGILPYKVPE